MFTAEPVNVPPDDTELWSEVEVSDPEAPEAESGSGPVPELDDDDDSVAADPVTVATDGIVDWFVEV
ncbi:hypothetical protein [Gordonia rhizosphera]|uniref:hypothetical protein n=1 Tax=Gordonia rhizosphera TaxID=83341 RepID=UPI0002ECBD00|nr:hypothetical protein [Gordonia rhizosphera]